MRDAVLGSQSEPLELKREVTILNKQGLHARPIMQFVDTAAQFSAEVRVQHNDTVVDGKSPMEMMLLAATQGSRLMITARGDDAASALEALEALIAGKFNEDKQDATGSPGNDEGCESH
jgi:phosphocarrier protein HPr